MTETNERVSKLYGFLNSQGYFYKNSISVFITITLFIVFFLINSYLFININTKYYKRNWVQWRCDPAVMPFAGIINTPPGESKLDYTFKNFSFCLNKLLDDIVAFVMAPVIFLIEIVTLVYAAIMLMIDEIVRMFDYLRSVITQIVLAILGIVMNFLIPFQKILIKAKVIMKKVHATNVTAIFTFLGTYMAMVSGILVTYEVLILAAFILAALIAVTWGIWLGFLGLNPIPLVIAVALTVILTIALILIIIIMNFISNDLGFDVSSDLPGIPSKPHLNFCFGPTTPINVCGKGNIPISEVKPGMKIKDSKKSVVTSVLKLSTDGQAIYKLYDNKLKMDLFVTGEHRVQAIINGRRKWVYMKNHPQAVLLKPEEFTDSCLYCLNTSSKMVKIGEYWFKDWDDLHADNYIKLQNTLFKNVKTDLSNKNVPFSNSVNPENIHPVFENGFYSSTLVSLKDGTTIPIKDVKIGSVLANGATVYGVVNIMNTFQLKQYDTNLICTNGCYVRSGKKAIPINIYCREKEIEAATLIKHNHRLDNPDDLWHLVTDLGFISCENMEILDYNYNIDIHL